MDSDDGNPSPGAQMIREGSDNPYLNQPQIYVHTDALLCTVPNAARTGITTEQVRAGCASLCVINKASETSCM